MTATVPSTSPLPAQGFRPSLIPAPRPAMPYAGPDDDFGPLAGLWADEPEAGPREPRDRIITWPVVVIFALAVAALCAAVWVGTRLGESNTEAGQAAVQASQPVATLPAAAAPPASAPGDSPTADEEFLTAMLDGRIMPTYDSREGLLTKAALSCEAMQSGAATWVQTHDALVGEGWLNGDADYFLLVATATYCPEFTEHPGR